MEKEKIVPTFFLGSFDRIDVQQGNAYITYARENEAKGTLLKAKEAELSAAFSRFAGETIRLHFAQEAPARRPSSDTTGPMQFKDRTQPEDGKQSKDRMSTSTKPVTVPTTAESTTPSAEMATDKGHKPTNVPGEEPTEPESDWTWQELQRTIPKEILKKME